MSTPLLPLPVLGALALSLPIAAQLTTRDSVGSGGIQGNQHSRGASLSRTGRYVAFRSQATNLVPGDTNGVNDVFVRERQAGVLVRASVGPGGVGGNGISSGPVISANGHFVAFYSEASNLVPLDTNRVPDVFVHDLVHGETERVSVDSLGAEGDSTSGDWGLSISATGRFVAFTSFAANLVPGDTNALMDVFVHDRSTGATARASVDSLGAQGNKVCVHPSISADGRLVAFDSFASNLVAGDTNGRPDVFVHDFATGATIRASVDSAGAQGIGSGGSEYPALSGDGRFVAFESWATNLVPGDTNFMRDVFVHELATGLTTRVSLSATGAQGNDHSWDASISRDGRFVAFSSLNSFVPGDTGLYDVFVRDRRFGTTTRVSVDSHGAQASSSSFSPSMSADGRRIAFDSTAANLVATDSNGFEDVFVHTISPGHRP